MILPNLIYAFESKKSIADTLNVHEKSLNVHEKLPDVHENVHEKSSQDIIPAIIDAIKINPKISLDELAELIGKSKRTIQRIIKNSEQIKRIGPDKGGHWEIIDKTFR